MKILIIFATALLVPIMMKFQSESILTQSNPKTAEQVNEVLIKHQVIEPLVAVSYLEATIAGRIASEAEATAVLKDVQAIRGVSTINNQLIVQGWLKLARVGDTLTVEGIVPSDWRSELLKGQPTAITTNLEWRESSQLAGKNAVAWGLFIDGFLRPEGDRALSLAGNRLLVSGEVTPSQLEDLSQRSESLGESVTFESEMIPRASPFHYETRTLSSSLEGEALRSLSQKLANNTLNFTPQSAELSAEGKAAAHRLVEHILQSPSQTTFILGGYPESGGKELAQQRALKVRTFLVENGIPSSRLEVVPFEVTEGGEAAAGQVELLVR